MTAWSGEASLAGSGEFSEAGTSLSPLVPDADSSDGGWTDKDGATSLFASIDEIIADDNDLIRSGAAPSADICKISLSNPSGTPAQPFLVQYRYGRTGDAALDLGVRLLQGVTEIAAWSHRSIGSSFVVAEQTLTAPQFAAISDFNDLFLEFNATTHGYDGPGDIVSGAVAWWGLRAYSNATIGSNAVRLRASGDNFEGDVRTTTGGGLDASDIATVSGHGGSLFVVTLYDQTGNGNDLTQATAANQPQFTASAYGSLPAFTFVAATPLFIFRTLFTQAQPFTFSTVHTNTNGNRIMCLSVGTDVEYYGDLSIYAGAGPVGVAITPSTPVAGQGVFSGASSELFANGLDSGTGNASTGAASASDIVLGAFSNIGGSAMSGKIGEAGIWPIAFSGTNATNMQSNQTVYWGI